jgi:hypothetical protein
VLAHYLTEAAAEQTGVGKWRYAPATLTRWVASINQVHTAAGLDPPGRSEVVRRALSGIRRIRATPPNRRAPLLLSELFAAGAVDCTRLTTETSDCLLSISFDYGNSITDRSYPADLVFTLRATCPESAGQGCTDEKGTSIPPGQEVTWTSSIRLTTTGCDPGCLKSGEGGVAESPDQPPADQPAPPADQPAPPADQPAPSPADQPAPPADQPTVAGPESVSGGGG